MSAKKCIREAPGLEFQVSEWIFLTVLLKEDKKICEDSQHLLIDLSFDLSLIVIK